MTAKDLPLERYWADRRCDQAPEQLDRLGVTLAIGPNFSHFLEVPRTDNLFNRERRQDQSRRDGRESQQAHGIGSPRALQRTAAIIAWRRGRHNGQSGPTWRLAFA